MDPPLQFLICSSISKQFCLQWKPYNMRYVLWVVALLEVCDVTTHGRHLGFSKKKTREFIVGFTSKITHK